LNVGVGLAIGIGVGSEPEFVERIPDCSADPGSDPGYLRAPLSAKMSAVNL